MNPILADIYSTIIPSAPYVIAAYVLLWAALFIFVFIVFRGVRKNESDIELLEEALSNTVPEQPASHPQN